MGGGTFANKTFANKTFANGESPGVYWRKYGGLSPIGEIPGDVLAKVQWTFANWRKGDGLSQLSRKRINLFAAT